MKYLIIFLFLIILMSSNNPTSNMQPVVITVLDSVTREPLTGVSIYSNGLKVFTDFDGKATIIPGKKVSVKYISYKQLEFDSIPTEILMPQL